MTVARLEPCEPYMAGQSPPVYITGIIDRLTRDEIDRLIVRFAGGHPEAFERALRIIWADRQKADRRLAE
jgi:hypothetical protein